jgi:hypothetical protein
MALKARVVLLCPLLSGNGRILKNDGRAGVASPAREKPLTVG